MPKGYSIVVGLDYVDEEAYSNYNMTTLKTCVKSTEAFQRFVKEKEFINVECETLKSPLINTQATIENFIHLLEIAKNDMNEDDMLLIYFNGHGGRLTTREAGEQGFDETLAFFNGQLKDDDFLTELSSFKPTQRILVVLESCYGIGMLNDVLSKTEIQKINNSLYDVLNAFSLIDANDDKNNSFLDPDNDELQFETVESILSNKEVRPIRRELIYRTISNEIEPLIPRPFSFKNFNPVNFSDEYPCLLGICAAGELSTSDSYVDYGKLTSGILGMKDNLRDNYYLFKFFLGAALYPTPIYFFDELVNCSLLKQKPFEYNF